MVRCEMQLPEPLLSYQHSMYILVCAILQKAFCRRTIKFTSGSLAFHVLFVLRPTFISFDPVFISVTNVLWLLLYNSFFCFMFPLTLNAQPLDVMIYHLIDIFKSP